MFAISDKLPGSNLCVVVHDANMLNRCQVKGVINQQENQRSMHGADRLIVHTHTHSHSLLPVECHQWKQ